MHSKTIILDGAVVRITEEDIRRLVATGIERGWVKRGDPARMAAEVRRQDLADHAARNRRWRERAKTIYA